MGVAGGALGAGAGGASGSVPGPDNSAQTVAAAAVPLEFPELTTNIASNTPSQSPKLDNLSLYSRISKY